MAVTAPAPSTNGTPDVKPGVVKMQEILAAEMAMVVSGFEELKRRGEGEFKVACRRNPKTGIVEIVFCGIAEKADLGPLRQLYQQVQARGVTF